MKSVICLILVIHYAYSLPQRGYSGNLKDVPIIKLNYEPNPDGSYFYEYQTGNNIVAQEQGYVKNLGNPNAEAQVMQGSFSYTGDDGQQYTINYIADEDGFKATGAHLPTPPPIPDEIQKSLAYNAAHPEEDESRGGRLRK